MSWTHLRPPRRDVSFVLVVNGFVKSWHCTALAAERAWERTINDDDVMASQLWRYTGNVHRNDFEYEVIADHAYA